MSRNSLGMTAYRFIKIRWIFIPCTRRPTRNSPCRIITVLPWVPPLDSALNALSLCIFLLPYCRAAAKKGVTALSCRQSPYLRTGIPAFTPDSTASHLFYFPYLHAFVAWGSSTFSPKPSIMMTPPQKNIWWTLEHDTPYRFGGVEDKENFYSIKYIYINI